MMGQRAPAKVFFGAMIPSTVLETLHQITGRSIDYLLGIQSNGE
uniref:Uncharacterized protein n=1 Tax=Myoviridae sp. ctr0w28 TaxID=2826703 RepID=A0A8S5NRR1_9CAUD|nr:MAG TPA: hypothetical protein [Myoviridae sp. ctr0w28]